MVFQAVVELMQHLRRTQRAEAQKASGGARIGTLLRAAVGLLTSWYHMYGDSQKGQAHRRHGGRPIWLRDGHPRRLEERVKRELQALPAGVASSGGDAWTWKIRLQCGPQLLAGLQEVRDAEVRHLAASPNKVSENMPYRSKLSTKGVIVTVRLDRGWPLSPPEVLLDAEP